MTSAREKRLNAFEEKRTIDAARVKSDLRRDGGSGPEIVGIRVIIVSKPKPRTKAQLKEESKHMEAHLLPLEKYLATKVTFGNFESKRRDLSSERYKFCDVLTKICKQIIHKEI